MASHLPPTPSPSPSPPLPLPMSIPQSATVPGRLNSATKKQHTKLNRLLIQRLPLALPPHTETPLLFSKGIVPFARIITLFETEWELLTRHFHRDPDAYSGHDYDVRNWLVGLRPPGLVRSHRLKNDLRHLRRVGGSSMYRTPPLGDKWVMDMRGEMRNKPHVLVAFAWVFYMAVFSGGRWIRQQLVNSGADFWTQNQGMLHLDKDQQSPMLDFPGITFLSFDGEQDGEEMKALFKTRLADAEWLLNDQEKRDVVDVAQQLFDRSIRLVSELDRNLYRQKMLSWSSSILRVAILLVALVYLFLQRKRFPWFSA